MSAKAPAHDLFPLLRPYYAAWLASSTDRYLIDPDTVAASPIWLGSSDPTAEVNPTTGAALAPGSMVSGTDGILYVADSTGTPRAQGSIGVAQTWTAEQTFGAGAAWLDDDTATFGTGDDLTIVHNGTNTLVTSATGNLVIDNTSATGHTYLDLGTDTAATSWAVRNNSGTALVEVTGAGLVTLADGTTLQRTGAGTGTGDVIERIGATTVEGMEVRVLEVTLSPAAIETAILTLPTNHVVDSVQANCQSALTGGGTTVTWGIGITGDVDAYGTVGMPTDSLAKNGKLNAIGIKAAGAGASIGQFSATTVALKLIGAATGGTSAGNTALTVGSVRVVVRYRVLVSLTDAP